MISVFRPYWYIILFCTGIEIHGDRFVFNIQTYPVIPHLITGEKKRLHYLTSKLIHNAQLRCDMDHDNIVKVYFSFEADNLDD